MWIILADYYGCPKNVALPNLHVSKSALNIADEELSKWTMGRLSNWLEGKDDLPKSLVLDEVLDNMRMEIDNV
jgi:hypothetical protein